MFGYKISAKHPLSPKVNYLGMLCRPQAILRNATSFVIRSIALKWSPTCSYASNLWSLAPKLSNGTKLPRILDIGTYGYPSFISSFFKSRLQKKKYKNIQLFMPLFRAKNKQTDP